MLKLLKARKGGLGGYTPTSGAIKMGRTAVRGWGLRCGGGAAYVKPSINGVEFWKVNGREGVVETKLSRNGKGRDQ
jgi:hypothetical protein